MRIEGSPRILTEGARSRYLNKTIIINNIFNKKSPYLKKNYGSSKAQNSYTERETR